MEKTNVMPNLRLNLVLLGKPGAGKSSSGNTILGREAFISEKSSTSVNQDFAAEDGDVGRLPITVYDTPGFSGRESKEELRKYEDVLKKCESGLCAFLVVLQCDRFTEEDQETVEKIEELLGEKRMQNTWILFTGEDQLKDENKSINHLIKETDALKILNQKYEGRFHSFNNKEKKPRNQVDSLISKVFIRNLENLQKKSQQRIPINIQDIPVNSRLSRRIVLLGKSGVGKSAAGNTILGQKEFKSEIRMNSVTRKCSEAHATVSGRSVSVVDTPGFFDTQMNTEELAMKVAESVYEFSSGPHAFLIVFPVNNRFTEQEQQIPQMIEMMFGQEVLKYSIILFTHGDQLEGESVEKLIEENEALRHLVKQCGGRYHVFNNKDQNNREQVNNNKNRLQQKINKDQNIPPRGQGRKHVPGRRWGCCGILPRTKSRSVEGEEDEGLFSHSRNLTPLDQNNRDQVNDLLQKIDTMIEQNGGGHYSNQMFEDARRFRREEEERRQREEEERKQQEEKEIQEEIERVRKVTEERIRAEFEEEEQRKEIEKVMKKEEERIRAEAKSKLESQSGFSHFISEYKSYFQTAAFVVGGIAVGALVLTGVGAGIGAGVGAVVTAVSGGGATLTGSVAGCTLSASVGAAAAGAVAAGAVGTGAGIGAAVGAGVGALAGGVAGAVIGVATTKDAS